MICINKGVVDIKGNGIELLSELTIILREHRKMMIEAGIPAEEADRQIDQCVETSRWSSEELKARAKEALKGLLRDLFSETEKEGEA